METSNMSNDVTKTFLENERGDIGDFVIEKDEGVTENEGNFNVSTLNGNIDSKMNSDSDVENEFHTPNSKVNNSFSIEEEKFKETSNKHDNLDLKTSEIDVNDKVKNDGSNQTSDNNDIEQVKEENINDSDGVKEEWLDILGTGQLKKKIIKAGKPDSRPNKSDVCVINLIGKLESGKVFEELERLEINLNDNEVVQGVDFALALMDQGEEAEVIVSPRFGYESRGFNCIVPPDATLHYQITLLEVKSEPLISTLNINARIEIGIRKKTRGNWWYAREKNTLAIHSYRRALDYLDDTDIPGEHTDEQVRFLLEERLKTYNNLGMTQMKIFAYDAALLSIDQVLNCQPKNVKALFRKCKILKAKGEITKSIAIIKDVLAIEPDDKAFQLELSQLQDIQRKENSKQRDLYKKMMGNSLQDNESDKKKKQHQYSTFKWIAAFIGALAIIGAVAFKYKV